MECWEIGNRPSFCADTAMPSRVCAVTAQVVACAVDGTVDHIAGVVDAQAGRVVDDGAVEVDLDQVGGTDFIEQ